MQSVHYDDLELRGGQQCVRYVAVVLGTLNERLELAPRECGPHGHPQRREAETRVVAVDINGQVWQRDVALARGVGDRRGKAGSKRGQKKLGRHRSLVVPAGLGRFVGDDLEAAHRGPNVVAPLPNRGESHSHGR